MTEAFEKWIKSQQGEASSFDLSEAEFWLRAFVKELDRLTDVWSEKVDYPCDLREALDELVQKFGLKENQP